MTIYTIRYALYDQAHDIGNGYYWTWKDEGLSKDSLIRFDKSMCECVPMNANTIKPDEIRGDHKKFEGRHVIYRFYNGGRDKYGRPNRCIILTAWLEKIEGRAFGSPELSEDEVNKIMQLPIFKQLESSEFAHKLPIPKPWFLSEQFPSEADISKAEAKELKDRNDLLIKEKKESEERLQRKIQELEQINSELAGKKNELESEIAGLRSNNSSLEEEKNQYVNRIKELRNEKEALRHLSAATQAVKPASFPLAQINRASSTTNSCVAHCKFVGKWTPQMQIRKKNNIDFVPVSYVMKIFDACGNSLFTSKIFDIDDYGNATLETTIPVDLLQNCRIDIQLERNIPQFKYRVVEEKRMLWFGCIPLPWTEKVEVQKDSPKDMQLLLKAVEPIFE